MSNVKIINLKELKLQAANQELANMLNELYCLKQYTEHNSTLNNKRELFVVSSYNDIVEVHFENGKKVRMSYDKKVISTDGELVEVVLLNDLYKLTIFNPFNPKQVNYKLVGINSEQTKEKEFITMLNKGWSEVIEENKFRILLDSEGQNEVIEKFNNLIFHEMKYMRYHEGYYQEGTYVVSEFKLTISIDGVKACIGAAPEFNKNSEDLGRNWYLNSNLQFYDSSVGDAQIEDGNEWSKIFSLSDKQVTCLSDLFNDYELLEKSIKEYDVRLIKHLQERIKVLKTTTNPGIIIQIRVVNSGFKLEYVEKNTRKLINSIATFEEQINM